MYLLGKGKSKSKSKSSGGDLQLRMSNLRKSPTFNKLLQSAKQSLRRKRSPDPDPEEERHEHLAQHANDPIVPPPPETNVMIWFSVIACSVFSILVILTGLVVLIGYLAFHPHIPKFNVKDGSLNSLLLDINFILSSDTTLVIEAHNPNDKVLLSYEYIKFELKFDKRTISSVTLADPSLILAQGPKNTTGFLLDLNTVAEQLEAREGEDLSISIQKNRISFDLEGTIKTKSKFGSITSVKYWMYTSCELAFSPPPLGNGTLLTHKCKSRK